MRMMVGDFLRILCFLWPIRFRRLSYYTKARKGREAGYGQSLVYFAFLATFV